MRKVMNQMMDEKALDKAVGKIVKDESMSKSKKMKELFHLGLDVKEISNILEVRYNFVYNVVSNMVIVEGVQVETQRKASKKDEVWKMLDEGKTVKEIAVDLKTNYNYIYKLKKEWEAAAVAEVAKLDKQELAAQ